MLGEICYSCKLHLLDSQTGTLGVSGGQQSRWMLKAGNYFAKFFLSFCSLNENENKRHEMQEWGAGVQTEAGERGLLFSMQNVILHWHCGKTGRPTLRPNPN